MKSDFTLYSNSLTVNSIKIALLCNAIGIKPDRKQVELHQGEQSTSQFLKLNPNGKVPVLVDGDFILSESNAILQYLSHWYQSPFWPSEIKAQSDVLKWLFWQSNGWNEAVGVFGHRRVVLPHWGFYGRQNLSQEHMNKFHQVMTDFDRSLSGKRVLVGNDFTIADISLGSYLIFASEAQMPLDDYVNVSRWLGQLRDMPWWQKTRKVLTEILN